MEDESRPEGHMLSSAADQRIHVVDVDKVSRGAFMTTGDSWLTPQVLKFIRKSGKGLAVDPFAGNGDMLRSIEKKLSLRTLGFDIDESLEWTNNDSLRSIPTKEDAIIVTNPPFLSKYSARRKSVWGLTGEYFEETNLGDLYMIALRRCLEAYSHVVAIVPETFISSSFPKDRCESITILEINPFDDTTFPVCVTCWTSESPPSEQMVYIDESRIGLLSEIWKHRIKPSKDTEITFNCAHGRIGLRAVDGVDPGVRIQFMPADQLGYDRNSIKVSSRVMTYIDIPSVSEDDIPRLTSRANEILEEARRNSHDVILSGFKSNNREGKRRRRLDYKLARGILESALSGATPPPSSVEIDWEALFIAACAKNRAQVVADAQASPTPDYLVVKVDNLIRDDGLNIPRQDIINQIPHDEVYQSRFMKHPTRQSFHEKTQIAHLNNWSSISAIKAAGKSQKMPIDAEPKDTKNWIDCIISMTGRKGHASMKYARIPGNHQEKQYLEQVSFVARAIVFIAEGRANPSDVFLAIGDGQFFSESKNSMVSDSINAYGDRIFAGTSGQAILWLKSLV